ncbi:MAG: response regulator [Oryzomonas sp.]|uniref:hybrid sensor histidine kinase/response regulator n=1 Tax=Oryzomonas sp. TaxID=2855186 RepID=UPI002847910D|nr:response regulator [Oryzomonas sp.]MDR3579739.1 response regulator [Oryzomonas sp.]
MIYLSIVLVLIGTAFLFKGLLHARGIWRNVHDDHRSKWLVILYLLIFFLFGYLLFDAILIFKLPLQPDLVTSVVFLGGAVFVFIIIKLSQSTISALQKTEENIKLINDSLESKVEDRTKELKSSYDFNRVVLDSIVDPISIIDVNSFRIINANLAFLKDVNLSKEQIIGRTCYEVTHQSSSPCTPPYDCCPLIETISHNDHAGSQHVHKTPSGETRYVEIVTSPIKDDQGKIVQAVHIQRDITERVLAEQEKLALEQQFQQAQKLESLGVLAGGIAHDFNNLLTIIIGNCHLAKMRPESADDCISKTEKAATRAAELCRQMLAYAGKVQVFETQINMWMLVDEMVKMLQSTMPPNVVITSALPSRIPLISGDAGQISQIIMNLIVNASEAIGDIQGEIRVSLIKAIIADQSSKDHQGNPIPPGSYVCLEVADNGYGMNEETKSRIFEPFYTTKFTGRGLGMSAVLGIISSHKGALQLNSHLGEGTTIKVYLPVQMTNVVLTRSLKQGVSISTWQGSGTILLVEDEEQVRSIAREMFQQLGFEIIESSNGKEALELYKENAADITMVVTDIGMPLMDGYTLIRELKKLNPDLPIIITSGFGELEVASRTSCNDISVIINKPYNIDQLREQLSGL